MRLNDLLRDVTDSAPSASQRSQQLALVAMLNERYGADAISAKGVEKWIMRGSIPGKWLPRIATVSKKQPLDLASYA
jgi:hypothetical protein